jgi:hypothetical protein
LDEIDFALCLFLFGCTQDIGNSAILESFASLTFINSPEILGFFLGIEDLTGTASINLVYEEDRIIAGSLDFSDSAIP